MTIKDSKYVKINKYEVINKSKYLTLVPTNESKENDYDEKYMKIKFISDDKFFLNKATEIPSMTIVVRAISYENNKFYPQVF